MEKEKKKEKKEKNGNMARVRRQSHMAEKTNETRRKNSTLKDGRDVT